MKKFLILLLILLRPAINFSQDLDSLKRELKVATEDTTRFLTLTYLANLCELVEIPSYATPALELADKILANKSLSKSQKEKFLDLKALALNSMGVIYESQGNTAKSLEYYDKSLKIYEQLGKKRDAAYLYNNIGMTYFKQGEFEPSMQYNLKAAKILEELKDKMGMANIYTNIAAMCDRRKDSRKALFYYEKSLKNFSELNYKQGMALSNSLVGFMNAKLRDFDQANRYTTLALKMTEEKMDNTFRSTVFQNCANTYYLMKELSKAKSNAESSLLISSSQGFPEQIKNSEQLLSKIDSALGNFKGAYLHYKNYIVYRDSSSNVENKKATMRNLLKNEFEKKENQLKEQQLLSKRKAEEQNHVNKVIIWSVSAGLILVFVFTLFISRNLLKIRRANQTITQQKEEVELQRQLLDKKNQVIEQKQKEIIDSIVYAYHIQQAQLPSERSIEKTLKRLMKRD